MKEMEWSIGGKLGWGGWGGEMVKSMYLHWVPARKAGAEQYVPLSFEKVKWGEGKGEEKEDADEEDKEDVNLAAIARQKTHIWRAQDEDITRT